MKRTVLTFGFLSGGLSALMMFATVPFLDRLGFDRGAYVGYTTIVVSFLFVYFGVRSYRDQVLGGRIGFGRAFGTGLLITLISCACYVAAWEVVYFTMMRDFPAKYSAYRVEQLRAGGASPEAIEAARDQADTLKALYENPFTNAAVTFTEPFPVGLVMTLLSAGLLRRKAV